MSRSLRQAVLPFVGLAVLFLLVAGLWAFVLADFRQASATDTGTASLPPTTTQESTQAPRWTMDQAREAVAADDSRVLVLGDSTGNGNDEWVHLWAGSREMPVASWDTDGEAGYRGEGEDTRVWSGAMFSATAEYPLEHEEIWPGQAPDVVLLSYGHFEGSGQEAAQGLEALTAEVAERFPDAPVVVVLQNPAQDDAGASVREAIAVWAKGEGLPTIDVAAAWEESGQEQAELLADDVNPSPAGSQVWAEAVVEALG